MCEHQLSHIQDFVSMQSQQNIQELGQTMKTLNHFYDDALNRSTVEVPDKEGNETRAPLTFSKYMYGCKSEIVHGKDPVDYDGTSLNNSPDNPMFGQRLIGKGAVDLPAHGTAEPEMRSIYILLTMDNEGGMEVLKYAARLFKERPAVYQSPPVQLALNIFKAKKEFNYVKFFSFLRAPSTPYLFCCMMFKYVELMRKVAFRIMSMTYGARNKDTGEAMYDQYPLDRLMKLLCFEDISEAREACKFYNITVKERQSQSGEIREIIFWRATKFREPKHPEKGHTLHLQPQKMVRTIESKLNGATRLAVCRGEVSGDGAALSSPVAPSESDMNATSMEPYNGDTRALSMVPTESGENSSDEARAKTQALLMKQKMERAKLEKQMKENEEQEKQERQEIDRRRREKERIEKEQQVKEYEKQKQAQLEKDRREQEEKERRLKEEQRLQQELADATARKVAEEAAQKKAEEDRIRRQEEEATRIREEKELLKERERQRRIAEEMRKKQLEEEKRRKEEEDRRIEILRQAQEAKRRRDAEETKKAKEWQGKLENSSKFIAWRRWQHANSRQLELSIGSRESLREIVSSSFAASIQAIMEEEQFPKATITPYRAKVTTRYIIEESLKDPSSTLSISKMAVQEIESLPSNNAWLGKSEKSTLLLKIAVICPATHDVADESFADLIAYWIDSRIKLNAIDTATSQGHHHRYEIRSVIVMGSNYEVCSSCDIVLFFVPPSWSDPNQKAAMLGHVASSLLDDDVPRVALVFSDNRSGQSLDSINELIARELAGNMESIPILHPSQLSKKAFDNAFELAVNRAVKIFVNETCVHVSRIPAMVLASKAITTVLWQCIPPAIRNGDEDVIVECSRAALIELIKELSQQRRLNQLEWSIWPPKEFSSPNGTIDSYYDSSEGLPVQWTRCLQREFLDEIYEPLVSVFFGHFRDVFQRILVDAPTIVRDDCAYQCAQGHYRRCLEKSLSWLEEASASSGFLYLPDGLTELVLEAVVSKVQALPVIKSTREMTEASSKGYDQNLNKFQVFTETESLHVSGEQLSESKTNAVSQPSNKRPRPVRENETVDEIPNENSTEYGQSREKRRREDSLPARESVSADIEESDEFTKKLERLLHGETVDMFVGDMSLSRILREVPKLDY